MENISHLHIKIHDIDLEVEGSEEFIEKQKIFLKELISREFFNNPNNLGSITQNQPEQTAEPPSNKLPITIEDILKMDFSDWVKIAFDKSTDDVISYLFAGYFIQHNNPDNYFTTKEAFSLLYQNGILLHDAEACEIHNLNVKNIVKVGTTKKQKKLRVTDSTIKQAQEILLMN